MGRAANLEELSEKHKSLKRQIEQELSRPAADPAQISALKLQKLKLKDEIAKLENKGA